MKLSKAIIKRFQEKILLWYGEHKRDLPWRHLPFDPVLQQRDPYRILVSEVMAQQTQLSRVIPKYEAWLKRFPTINSLAEAPAREVLLLWSGLGYNGRALRLQRAARILVDEHKGKFPRTFEELIKLPGIGKYTANALLCFAFDQQVAVVDTNVRKAIVIEVLKEPNGPHGPKVIGEIAEKLLPKGRAYVWNQALMDYSGSVLKKEKILSRSEILLRRTKQSPFRTSSRYYRGQTMKLLVRQHAILLDDLWQFFDKDNPIEKEKLLHILQKMEKDGLLWVSNIEVRII